MKENKNMVYLFLVVCVLVVVGAVLLLSGGKPVDSEPITVRQAGGSAMLIAECANRSYITNTAAYIIEGTVGNVETRWNDGNTSIVTYSSIAIDKYLKGTLPGNKILMETSGGCVGGVCQAMEDQPTFHEGKKVRIYLQETNGSFSIVCAQFGVEEIKN
ncbi:MAG: hypothetical protein V1492_05315 [Candidatus Micrarchaeota archaeon]